MASRVAARQIIAKASDHDNLPHPSVTMRQEESCKCTACCICLTCWPLCCKEKISGQNKKIDYEACETHDIGYPLPGSLSSINEVDGVEWKVERLGDDDVFVIIHYQSLIDNSIRSCKMKLRINNNNAVDEFMKAKKFVAIINNHKILFDHPAGYYKNTTKFVPPSVISIDYNPEKKFLDNFLLFMKGIKDFAVSLTYIETYMKLFGISFEDDGGFWDVLITIKQHPRKSFATWLFFFIIIVIIYTQQ